MPLRVALVNDYDIVVRGLADVLAGSSLDVVLLGAERLGEADVILYDTFGSEEGWRGLTRLLDTGKPVVVFSWESPSAQYLDLIESGVAGHLSKGADASALVAALRTVAAGGTIHPEVERASQTVGAWPGQEEGLTARESEILAYILQGLGNDEIARAMFLSVNTIKTHVRTAYRKMGVVSRAQAILWGVDHGLRGGTRPNRSTSF